MRACHEPIFSLSCLEKSAKRRYKLMFYLPSPPPKKMNIWLKSPRYLSAPLHALCWQFGKGLDHGPGHLTRMRGLSIKIKEICVICIRDKFNWWTTVKNRRSSIHGPNPTPTKTFLFQTKTITIRASYEFLFNCLKQICQYLFVII